MNGKGEFFEDRIVAWFVAATVAWALFGMLAGLYLAAEMVWPILNWDLPGLTFGRLRTVHTNSVVFGFGGSALIGTSFYSVQRTCRARLFAPRAAWFVFWGLAGGVGVGDGDAFFGDEQRQRIRRIRMAARYRGRDFVDRLRRRLFRHDCEAESAPRFMSRIGFTARSSSC